MYFNCHQVVNMQNSPLPLAHRPARPSASRRAVRAAAHGVAPAASPVEALRLKHRKETLLALRDNGTLSRVALGRRIGLSPTTLTKVMAELIGLGWVTEVESPRAGEIGRPQIGLALVSQACEVLAVAVEPDAITLAQVGLDLEPRAVERQAFAALDPQATLKKLSTLIARYRAAHTGARAIAVVVPGTIDSALRSVLWAKPLGWQRVAFADQLETACGLPVVLQNNTRAMGLAEFRHLDLHEDQPLLFVQTRFGLGASLVASATPARNGHYGVSELATLPLGRNAFRSRVAGDRRLVSVVNERYLQAVLKVGPDDGPVLPLLEKRRDAGNSVARRLYAQTVDNLARGLAVAVDILQPHIVVLGGIYRPASQRFVADLLRRLHRHAQPELMRELTLQCSGLGTTGALQGAAMVAFERVLMDATTYRIHHPG
jgi:predicted NBD/HSP70 family sugar kinase